MAISTLMDTEDVDVVVPLPQGLQAHVSFAGVVSRQAAQQADVQELLKFIAEPDPVSVIRHKGLEPWR